MKSFKMPPAPSAKPCDVEYRLNRLKSLVADSLTFLGSIDQSVFPDTHQEVSEAMEHVKSIIDGWEPPMKRSRKLSCSLETSAESAVEEREIHDSVLSRALSAARARKSAREAVAA